MLALEPCVLNIKFFRYLFKLIKLESCEPFHQNFVDELDRPSDGKETESQTSSKEDWDNHRIEVDSLVVGVAIVSQVRLRMSGVKSVVLVLASASSKHWPFGLVQPRLGPSRFTAQADKVNSFAHSSIFQYPNYSALPFTASINFSGTRLCHRFSEQRINAKSTLFIPTY